MQSSDDISWASNFSHIYVEHAARDYPLSDRILGRYPNATVVPISNYKQVFARSRQDFRMQKNSQKLILATKKDEFLYPGSEQCQNYGNRNFFYTTPMLNCVYDCEYCYLQGLLPSANLVLFVNTDDFVSAAAEAVETRSHKDQPLYLSISYDTDLMAFERVTNYCHEWIAFAAEQDRALIEIRTKSAAYSAISDHPPLPNVILSWTLSPDSVISRYERGTPPLEKRLAAIERAVSDGWRVRLCFDPVLAVDGWQEEYATLIRETFKRVPADSIQDVAIGGFRMSKTHFHRIRKARLDSDLFYGNVVTDGETASYPAELQNQVLSCLEEQLSAHVGAEQVFPL